MYNKKIYAKIYRITTAGFVLVIERYKVVTEVVNEVYLGSMLGIDGRYEINVEKCIAADIQNDSILAAIFDEMSILLHFWRQRCYLAVKDNYFVRRLKKDKYCVDAISLKDMRY